MAKSTRQYVFEGMELLPAALIPFVEKRLESSLKTASVRGPPVEESQKMPTSCPRSIWRRHRKRTNQRRRRRPR